MFTSNNSDDTEMLRQMRLLGYIVGQIDTLECLIGVAKMCFLNCEEVSVHFIVFIFGLFTKNYIF